MNTSSDNTISLNPTYLPGVRTKACLLISSSVTDDGYRIVGGDDKYREYVTEFLDFMKSEDVFANAASCMQIYGEAFIEIIYKKKGSIPATDLKSIKEKDRFKKEISGIRVINPKNMLIVRDSLGKYIKYKTDEGIKTIAYAQVAYDIATTFGHVLSSPEDIKKLTNYKGSYVLFEPEEMLHLKFGEIGDAGYGLSPVYALRNTSYQRRQMDSI